MKISFDDIMTYAQCPMLFLLKNIRGLETDSLRDKFNEAIKKAIFHFYYNVMEDKILKAEDMKSKWESLWFNNKKMADILYGQQDTHVKMGYRGADMLVNFHRNNWQSPGRPLVIDHAFEVPIGAHVVTGKFELIKESIRARTMFIEVINFSTSDTLPDDLELRTNLYTTLQSYAFRKEFNAKEQLLTTYFLKNGETRTATRRQDQFNKLENFVDIVCTSIASNFYFPRPSYICRSCKVREYCAQWGVK